MLALLELEIKLILLKLMSEYELSGKRKRTTTMPYIILDKSTCLYLSQDGWIKKDSPFYRVKRLDKGEALRIIKMEMSNNPEMKLKLEKVR